MTTTVAQYVPASLLILSGALGFAVGTPQPTPLAAPLASTIPTSFDGVRGVDLPIGADEAKASGVSDYLIRRYDVGSPAIPVELYIGYHATQQGDYHMHSPDVCLPGSGWAPEDSRTAVVQVGSNPVRVNRYLLRKGPNQILVYYWFQARGQTTTGWTRFSISSFAAAFKAHRDEEALVRIVVPIENTTGADGSAPKPSMLPDSLAAQLAAVAIPAVNRALPPAS